MRRAVVAAALLGALVSPCRAAPPAVPSWHYLTTGNGFGFQVFDTQSGRVTQFLERPYRFLRPGSDPRAEGVLRRDLAYDAYFGLRAGASSGWLPEQTQSEVGYLDQSSTIRSVASIGGVKAESFFFSPFGLQANAMVMLLKVTNTGAAPVPVEAFTNPNFRMGTGSPDEPGGDGERIESSPARSIETGNGQGAMLYLPLGTPTRADCTGGAYQAVQSGQDVGTVSSCMGQDLTLVMQKSLGALAPGQSAWWGVVAAFSPEASELAALEQRVTAFVAGRTPEQLLSDTQAEWETWRKPPPPGLSDAERRVWRQAETTLRLAQVLEPWRETPRQKGHGMLLASLPPGQWHIGWVRDAAYAMVALARMGHHTEAKRALDFFLNAEAGQYPSYVGGDYRISVTRYFGDGLEESDWNALGPNIELDGWGLYLWAARAYVEASGDLGWLQEQTQAGERIADVLREGIAVPLGERNLEDSGIVAVDNSIWESHWDLRKHYAYSSLAAARGLCDFGWLASRAGQAADSQRFARLAQRVAQGTRAKFLDPKLVLAGSVEELPTGRYYDAATVEALNWEVFPSTDPLGPATLDAFRDKLRVASGGYMRNDDAASSYDSQEWIIIDLRIATAARKLGRAAEADELTDWVTRQGAANFDLIPELFNVFPSDGPVGAFAGASPMVGFGAGAYVLALLDRAGAVPEGRACGETDLSGAPDGGTTPPPSDGCSCATTSGARRSSRAALPWFILVSGVGMSLWRRRRVL